MEEISVLTSIFESLKNAIKEDNYDYFIKQVSKNSFVSYNLNESSLLNYCAILNKKRFFDFLIFSGADIFKTSDAFSMNHAIRLCINLKLSRNREFLIIFSEACYYGNIFVIRDYWHKFILNESFIVLVSVLTKGMKT